MTRQTPQPIELPPTLGRGRFHVLRQLGRGGMCVVVEVVDQTLGVERAAKFLLPSMRAYDWATARLGNEARTMSRVHHPNVLKAFDLFDDRAVGPVLILDLARPLSLLNRLKERGPLPGESVLAIGESMARALVSIHDRDIVHRDVKPGNVLLGRSGAWLLSDFGIAKGAVGVTKRVTATGHVLGTHRFCPPEQRVDPANVDHRADIYALGATLYTLAVGKSPVSLGHTIEVRGPEVLEPLPSWLRPVVARACRFHPESRFSDAEAMLDALLEARSSLVHVPNAEG